MKRVLITFIGATLFLAAPPSQASDAASLRDKNDAELLQLVTGSSELVIEKPKPKYDEDQVAPSPLDRLWEMDPRDAAVAFVSDNVSKEAANLTFEIDDRNAKPPAAGEIGLRWISGNNYAPPAEGLTRLKYDGYKSELLLSEVEIEGQPSKEEIEEAVLKTDSHPVRRLVAQQTYEILWWLRHVRTTRESNRYSSGSISSNDDFGRFWMKPDGPDIAETILSEPCGDCLAQGDNTTYQGFAFTLLRRLAERSSIKRRYPIPRIGVHIDPDEDAKFLHTFPPDKEDVEPLKNWIGRLTEILRNPERQYLYDDVLDLLVPISDPLRYDDRRINSALLDLYHRGKDAVANFKPPEPEDPLPDTDDDAELERARAEHKEKRREQSKKERAFEQVKSDAQQALYKLGFHDAEEALPELLQILKNAGGKKMKDFQGYALIGAASIVGRHPRLRVPLTEFLRPKLEGASQDLDTYYTTEVEAAWRADLREFAQLLESIAQRARPADKNSYTTDYARAVLLAWRESDPLTKTKIDAILSGYVGHANTIPEMLRAEFEALRPEDKFTFRNFVTWMRSVDVPWSSRRYLEGAFTPHTPRPDTFLGQ